MKDRMHPSRSQGNVLEQFLTLFQRNSGLEFLDSSFCHMVFTERPEALDDQTT